ncbi:hypothetical protein [Trinickia sp. Y13]|uniref:hypothetical protein n=1 Tax=Trinickia sp. Y13 TaxID=2917807 RepID=UPI002404E263|nr:hypothetical protein [Trinickia sp. Y13]MDG0022633.1 hypothetical protein [Trinickia sp. Y13]
MASNVERTGGTGGLLPSWGGDDSGTPNGLPSPSQQHRDERLPSSIPSGSAAWVSFRHASPPAQARAASRPVAASSADVVVDEAYLGSLERQIAEAFAPHDRDGSPEADRRVVYLENADKAGRGKVSSLNPLALVLPERLLSYPQLYDSTRIVLDQAPASEARLVAADAQVTYRNLMKQYSLAYVSCLRAANGSEQAQAELKALFEEGKVFDAAGVQTEFLSSDPQTLSRAMLGHLSVAVLCSPDTEITTAARIKVLENLRDHADLDSVIRATVADKNTSGLIVDGRTRVFDLIPLAFMPDRSAGHIPHTQMFWANDVIKEILPERRASDGRRFEIDLDQGVAELTTRYRKEAVQVLLGLMRTDDWRVDREAVFRALIGLTELDDSQKNRIFGENASYRNNGVTRPESIEALMGGDIDESDLRDMPPQDVLRLIRGMASENRSLRARLASSEGGVVGGPRP